MANCPAQGDQFEVFGSIGLRERLMKHLEIPTCFLTHRDRCKDHKIIMS